MKYDVAAGVGQALHDTATAFGVGATLGVKVKALPTLSFGAAWESRSYSRTSPSTSRRARTPSPRG